MLFPRIVQRLGYVVHQPEFSVRYLHQLTRKRRYKWDTKYLRICRQQDWVLGLAGI